MAANTRGSDPRRTREACKNEPTPTAAARHETSRSFDETFGMTTIVGKLHGRKRESRSTWTGLQLQRAIASINSVGQMGEA